MNAFTATASMQDWFNQGWVINATHVIVALESPPLPPAATTEQLREWNQPSAEIGGDLEGDLEFSSDILEEMAVAREVLANYETMGLDASVPYSKYRAKRLESDS